MSSATTTISIINKITALPGINKWISNQKRNNNLKTKIRIWTSIFLMQIVQPSKLLIIAVRISRVWIMRKAWIKYMDLEFLMQRELVVIWDCCKMAKGINLIIVIWKGIRKMSGIQIGNNNSIFIFIILNDILFLNYL